MGSPMNDRPLGTKLTLEHAGISDSGVVAAAASLTLATPALRHLKVSSCMIRPSRWQDYPEANWRVEPRGLSGSATQERLCAFKDLKVDRYQIDLSKLGPLRMCEILPHSHFKHPS